MQTGNTHKHSNSGKILNISKHLEFKDIRNNKTTKSLLTEVA